MTALAPDPNADLATTATGFRAWLDERAAALDGFRHEQAEDMEPAFARFRPLLQMLWEDGWTKLGWPVEVGGLGGSPLHRYVVVEELAAAGYVVPEVYGAMEIIGPMLLRFAPHLAADHIAAGMRNDEVWCQGFSEPDAGSDLGSLRTRAAVDGDGFRLTGQKMWSSNGVMSSWSCVLARTGETDSGYRGLTMFWVDLSAAGVRVVPTRLGNGRHETAEIFLDDVYVPGTHVIGEVGQGWSIVMFLMQFERGAYAWGRQASMHSELTELLADHADEFGPGADQVVGDAYLALFGLRSVARETIGRLAEGELLGPESSIDKILLSAAEQTMTEAARQLLYPRLELADTDDGFAQLWRSRWAYSRITTIYGGAGEVQRDLVAERLLGLPEGALMKAPGDRGSTGFDADELALVRASLRHALDTHDAAGAPAALAAAGWTDLLDADAAAALTALGEEAGASGSTAPVADLAVLWAAGLAGDATTAVVYDGIVLDGADRAGRFAFLDDAGITAVETDAVVLVAAGGLDPAAGLRRIASPLTGHAPALADAATAGVAIAAARRAVASQLVGSAEQMLVDTLGYVNERHQYGRAIGSFQAVKHRLADVKVAITVARAGVRTAWEHADHPAGTTLAIAAKCLAGRAQQVTSTHCFQVHGGIAFTAEHGFQDRVRRGMLLDVVLGGHERLTRELGRRIVAAGAVPRVPDLY